MTTIITGSSGFIGSHLSSQLSGSDVLLIDKEPSKVLELDSVQMDLADFDIMTDYKCDNLYHLAASAKIREESFNRMTRDNINALSNVLNNIQFDKIVFTSTSAVYGDAKVLPTPEDQPFKPISYYAMTKAFGEWAIKKHCTETDGDYLVLRFGNVVGPGAHGVIPDFIAKLRADPTTLEVLGDGYQKKSYVHIDDILRVLTSNLAGTFNVSTFDSITVRHLAEIVCEEMDVSPEIHYTGGQKGWKGDVTTMCLDISKLESLGLAPKMSSEHAVRQATKELLKSES